MSFIGSSDEVGSVEAWHEFGDAEVILRFVVRSAVCGGKHCAIPSAEREGVGTMSILEFRLCDFCREKVVAC